MTDYDDDEYLSDEEKQEKAEKYQKEYIDAVTEQASSTPLDEQDDIFKAMKGITYDPSGKPKQDAELNFLRAEKIAKKKARKTYGDPLIKSYSKYMKRADNLSAEETRKKVREYLKGDD